jgi:hypothetical protein
MSDEVPPNIQEEALLAAQQQDALLAAQQKAWEDASTGWTTEEDGEGQANNHHEADNDWGEEHNEGWDDAVNNANADDSDEDEWPQNPQQPEEPAQPLDDAQQREGGQHGQERGGMVGENIS